MGTNFAALLKSYRLRASYGLRQFAEMVGDSSANYANREAGKRGPWKDNQKLRLVAETLGLREGSQDWNAFFIAARGPGVLPPDTEHLLSRPMIPVLLRTVDELKLSEEDLRELIDSLKREKGK